MPSPARAFSSEACPGRDPGWIPVRVKKTRQIKNLEPRFDSIETEMASGMFGYAATCRSRVRTISR